MKTAFNAVILALVCVAGFSSLAAVPKQYDDSHIVGHLSFKENLPEDIVIEVAKHFAAEFPEFVKLSVRQDGEKSFGVDVIYKPKSRMDLRTFTAMLKKSVETKFGKDIMTGWDVSGQVLWVKK